MRSFKATASAAIALLLSACGSDSPENYPPELLDPAAENVLPAQQEQALVGGIDTTLRPEIGTLSARKGNRSWSCTATLIAPSYVLTAGHCVDFSTALDSASVKLPNASAAINVTAVHTFGAYRRVLHSLSDFPTSVDDVALLRLASAVPSSVATPAEISIVPPNSVAGPYGTQTIFGYGCKVRSTQQGGGVKQYVSFTYGEQTQAQCQGDSGGPVVFGAASGSGAIWGVNSGFDTQTGVDGFGSASYFKEEILGVIRSWEGSPVEGGIARSGITYSTLTLPTASDCSLACRADAKCRGTTFRSSGTKCELKSALGEWSLAADATSYTGPQLSQELFLARNGSEYRSIAGSSIEGCLQACASDASCKAYTMNAGTGTCSLKNAVPASSVDFVAISGVKRNLEANTDRPGLDYSHLTQPSAADCMRSCSTDLSCRTFSWVASTRVCYLRSKQTKPVTRSGTTSGIKRGLEMNTDRMGGDYRDYDINFRNTPQVCQADCAADANCKAFTFAPAGWNGEKAHCWLKGSVAAKSTVEGLVSGVRGLDFF
jgi:hypothetical protein